VAGSASREELSAVGRSGRTAGSGGDSSAGDDRLGRIEVHDAGGLIGRDRSAISVAAVGATAGGECSAGREGRESIDTSGGHRMKICRTLVSHQVGERDFDVAAVAGGVAVAAGDGSGELGVGDSEGAVKRTRAWCRDDESEVCTSIRRFTGDTARIDRPAGGGIGEEEGAREVLTELGQGHGEAKRGRRRGEVGVGDRVLECRRA